MKNVLDSLLLFKCTLVCVDNLEITFYLCCFGCYGDRMLYDSLLVEFFFLLHSVYHVVYYGLWLHALRQCELRDCFM